MSSPDRTDLAHAGVSQSKVAQANAPAWSPLTIPLFRALWIATVAGNIGTWMQDVGASWLMTSLSPSLLFVSLVQTATSLPIFLLALPSGALADVIDRREARAFHQGEHPPVVAHFVADAPLSHALRGVL
jgi:hypothetical protein